MMDGLPVLATVREVVAASRLSRATIHKAIKTGDLRSVMLCGRRLVYVDSYIAWLRRHESPSLRLVGDQTGERKTSDAT
jgi:predicted DNA-binding transcriptional regulator AlpA